jgi:hypothetical protein
MFQHNSGMPGAISTKLGTHMDMDIYIYIYICNLCIYTLYINIKIDVCVFVGMYVQHNSGTPGALSTKLGTHLTIYIYKNIILYIIYVIYIYI